MERFLIQSPGGYTTVQDLGRFGYQNMGIPLSGVLDRFSFFLANALVGNTLNSAALELTIMGPSIQVLSEVDIALAGARMGLKVNGQDAGQWRSVRVKPGDEIVIGQITTGCRAYLAVSGGIKVPEVMGSRSTYAGAAIGGFQGRALKKDDRIESYSTTLLNKERVVPEDLIPDYPSKALIRAVPGPQDMYFDEGIKTIFQTDYMVTAKADRMGYRLMGSPIPIKNGMPKSIVSEPSMPGGIQIPADEQPIILLVEQTVGGYAKIATVISSDLSKVAQTTPGDMIAFEKVNLETAHEIYTQEKNRLDSICSLLSG
jgi:antagonist of KipI